MSEQVGWKKKDVHSDLDDHKHTDKCCKHCEATLRRLNAGNQNIGVKENIHDKFLT